MTNDGQYVYIYDCENRLLEVKEGETTIVTYAYDYQGRRVRKTVGSTVLCYCYDGDQIIADYNGSGVLQRKYVYGPGIDEPICMIDCTGQSEVMYYYFFDGLGSVIALNDTNRTMPEKYKYDVFGKPSIRGPSDEPRGTSNVSNRYMFTGREYDSETGNYYYRARYYSSKLGRFLQPDPIGYRDVVNLYSYTRDNPVNRVDPSGLSSFGNCFSNCMNTMLFGLPGIPGAICGGALGTAAKIAAAAGCTTLSCILNIVPAWMGGAAFGCGIGCGIFGGPGSPIAPGMPPIEWPPKDPFGPYPPPWVWP